MGRIFQGLLFSLAGLLFAACPGGNGSDADGGPDPLGVSVSLTFKPSCGAFAGSYKADCISALVLVAEDADGVEIDRSCTPLGPCEDCLSDRLGVLTDLVLSGEVARLPNLPTQKDVVMRVIALHDVDAPDGADPCANQSSSRWLMWGRSKRADFSVDAGTLQVNVPVECRQCTRGCDGVGETCPVDFPNSQCIPASADPPEVLGCDRVCDPDNPATCFDGDLVCDPNLGRCEIPIPTYRGFCRSCRTSDECASGFGCVIPIGKDEGLCSPVCPQTICKSGAICTPVGQGTAWRRVGGGAN
jgi:hypothetical protein